MRKFLLPMLLLLCLTLGGCSSDPLAPMVTTPAADELPAPAVDNRPQKDNTAILWFRFGDEPLLTAETREIAYSPSDGYALTLLQALLQGPSAASTELGDLFPQGTKVVSVRQEARCMFVTLSKHILNGYADEPAAWRSDAYWAIEVPLRRQLAMQAIAATLTENCDVDTVVILVEQPGSSADSLRLSQGYYTGEDDPTLAAPLQRDEALLLTPARAAEIILQCWQESDWARLYRYVARTDPATGLDRPDEAAFVQQMSQSAHLLRATAQGGSISGSSAVFTVSGVWLDNGTEQPFSGMVLKLVKERNIWRIGLSGLTRKGAQP